MPDPRSQLSQSFCAGCRELLTASRIYYGITYFDTVINRLAQPSPTTMGQSIAFVINPLRDVRKCLTHAQKLYKEENMIQTVVVRCFLQSAHCSDHLGAISDRPCLGTECPLLLCPGLREQIVTLLGRIESQEREIVHLQSCLADALD